MPIVAPFTGAWIEIGSRSPDTDLAIVAPFTGAWIEIVKDYELFLAERVAPFTGAWIEIRAWGDTTAHQNRRSLHGSVD